MPATGDGNSADELDQVPMPADAQSNAPADPYSSAPVDPPEPSVGLLVGRGCAIVICAFVISFVILALQMPFNSGH